MLKYELLEVSFPGKQDRQFEHFENSVIWLVVENIF